MVILSGPFSAIPKFLPAYDEPRGRLTVSLMPSAGLLDWAAAVQFIAEDPSVRAMRAALLDVRASAFTPSLQEGQALSDRLRLARASFDGPIAIVAARDLAFAASRVIASYADASGASVAVFRDEAEALAWLDAEARHPG